MVIQHNMASMFTARQLNISNSNQADSSKKLSSGYRINSAADDAAGLTISEKLRWQIRGLERASMNIQDGISLVQVADGALNESHAVLQRMNELSVQAANDTNTFADRSAIQAEIDQLGTELDRIAKETSFNSDIYPLNGGGFELPPGIAETPITVVNSSANSDIHFNGNVYGSGTSFTIPNVLSIMNAPDYTSLSQAAIINYTIDALPFHGSAYTTSSIFLINNPGPHRDYGISYYTLDDLKVDENGYLYIDDRTYLCNSSFKFITDPTVENLEKAGAKKVIDNNQIINIQSGALAYQAIQIPLVNATARKLGVVPLDVSTHFWAGIAMDKIQIAIDRVSEYRSTFGALHNRLTHARSTDDNTAENSQAAESRIRDTNMAEEMVDYASSSIISQAAQAMLAQANSLTDGVLSLLST